MTDLPILFSRGAQRDMRHIIKYLLSEDVSKERILYIRQGIEDAANKINPFPQKHPMFDNNPAIRYTRKWRYKIIFRITKDKIFILRIFHMSQDPTKINIRY